MRDGRRLECWASGASRPKIVEPPTLPYFWSCNKVPSSRSNSEKRKLLSTLELADLYRILCPNVYEVKRRRQRVPSAFEAQVRFIERLAQDYGFTQNDTEASLLAFDVEALSRGQFPHPDLDPVIALASYSPSTQKCLVDEESEILAKSVEIVQDVNPDVIATYAGTAFDYDFPDARSQRLGVHFGLGRMGDRPYTKVREFKMGRKIGVDKTTYLHGRICFDVYKEALFDSALSGVRHDLKSVARHFFGDRFVTEVDRQDMGKLSEQELASYCFRDARLTYKLAEHYLAVLKPLAVMLRVPLDFIVHRSPSHIGNIVYGRDFNKLGIVSDGANFERFTGVLW